jgi:hypothetical protein
VELYLHSPLRLYGVVLSYATELYFLPFILSTLILWCEADHSTPYSAEVKNAWSYTSTHQYAFMAWCLVKHRYKFLFYLTFTCPAYISVSLSVSVRISNQDIYIYIYIFSREEIQTIYMRRKFFSNILFNIISPVTFHFVKFLFQ